LTILERVPLSGRKLNPGQQACLGVRAVCHARTGNTAKARKDRDRVYSFNPRNPVLAEVDRVMTEPMARAGLQGSGLHHLSPEQFEDVCAEMFRRLGYKVTATPASHDGGIDLYLTMGPETSVVQCKRTAANVGAPVVRDLYGVIRSAHAVRGYLCTSAGFTNHAVAFAADKPIELVDGPTIVRSLQS